MFSTRKFSLAAAGLAGLFAASSALAGTMVVRATGPSAASYPVGKQLPATGTITLKAGDMLTVMDAGGTRVLRGPGAVAVAGTKAATGSGFAALVANTGAKQSRTGATRAAIGGGPARSPNVWYVDASKSGTQCLLDAASATLWRPDSSAAGTVAVARDGKSVNVDYRAGQSVRAWPADLPIEDGASFDVTLPGGKAEKVKMVLVKSDSSELDGIATTLLGKGCKNQVDVLVEGSMQETPQVASAAH